MSSVPLAIPLFLKLAETADARTELSDKSWDGLQEVNNESTSDVILRSVSTFQVVYN